MTRHARVIRLGVAGALSLGAIGGCGGDEGSAADDAAPRTTTTAADLSVYRQQYLGLLTANECSAAETTAVQNEIAPTGTVDAEDFPILRERLQPAWAARAEAIASFQDGLANGGWSGELDPLVDEVIAHLEEIRAVYRSGSTVESFEEFGALIFPPDGTSEIDLHAALELPPPDELQDADWCNGVPPL